MSSTSSGDTPLRRLIVRRQAEQERDAAADVIGAECEQLWRSLLVAPVTEFVPYWTDVWVRLAAHLRSGNHAQAADELIQLNVLLKELQRTCESWRIARDRWFREKAEPWHQRYPNRGGFSRLHPYHEPDWLFFWIRDPCRLNMAEDQKEVGPSTISARVASWLERNTIGQAGAGHEAIYLLGLLGSEDADADRQARRIEFEQCVANLSDRERLADVCLILAAVVLPSPEIVQRFFDGHPTEEAIRLAEWIVRVSEAEVGKGLLAIFQQCCPAPNPPQIPTSTLIAQPADAPSLPHPVSASPEPTDTSPYSAPTPTGKSPKRSTQRGEGRDKLIAALTKHHEYADGGCLNLEPIGNNELARQARVSTSTAWAFFDDAFNGHSNYKTACKDPPSLVAALKLLNGEFAPHHLFGTEPPGEEDRHEE